MIASERWSCRIRPFIPRLILICWSQGKTVAARLNRTRQRASPRSASSRRRIHSARAAIRLVRLAVKARIGSRRRSRLRIPVSWRISRNTSTNVRIDNAVRRRRSPSIVGGSIGAKRKSPLFVGHYGCTPFFNDVVIVGGGASLQCASSIAVAATLKVRSPWRLWLNRGRKLIDALSVDIVRVSRSPCCPVVASQTDRTTHRDRYGHIVSDVLHSLQNNCPSQEIILFRTITAIQGVVSTHHADIDDYAALKINSLSSH
jgi:hypothetical protein